MNWNAWWHFSFFFSFLSQLLSHFSIQTIGSDASCISIIPACRGFVHENPLAARLSDSDRAHCDAVLTRVDPKLIFYQFPYFISKAALFKMWIKTLMGTHDVQRLHPLLVGIQLLSNHSLHAAEIHKSNSNTCKIREWMKKMGRWSNFKRTLEEGGGGGRKKQRLRSWNFW